MIANEGRPPRSSEAAPRNTTLTPHSMPEREYLRLADIFLGQATVSRHDLIGLMTVAYSWGLREGAESVNTSGGDQ